MSTRNMESELSLLERKVDQAMEELAHTFPHLTQTRTPKRQKDEEERRSDELALGALREIRERLSP